MYSQKKKLTSTCVFPVFLEIAMAEAPATDLWIGLVSVNRYPFYWTDGRKLVTYSNMASLVSGLVVFHYNISPRAHEYVLHYILLFLFTCKWECLFTNQDYWANLILKPNKSFTAITYIVIILVYCLHFLMSCFVIAVKQTFSLSSW